MSIENIFKDLQDLYWKELQENEGITKADIEMVMLEFGFSPVIPFMGDSPVEVTETIGGKYIVHHPMFPNAIDTEQLKVMRYRYLSNRKNPFL